MKWMDAWTNEGVGRVYAHRVEAGWHRLTVDSTRGAGGPRGRGGNLLRDEGKQQGEGAPADSVHGHGMIINLWGRQGRCWRGKISRWRWARPLPMLEYEQGGSPTRREI